MLSPKTISLTLLLFAATRLASAQGAPPVVDNDFVQKQFGATCTVLPAPAPVVADLDGDGVTDIVIPAHCKNPMLDQSEDNFLVIDPYDTFFGYGNTKITSEFASEDPERRGIVLLIIHGAGPDAWRAATPKAKFLIINWPYKEISVKKLKIKKKTILGIYAIETGSDAMNSATFWDGKKYRYVPLGASME